MSEHQIPAFQWPSARILRYVHFCLTIILAGLGVAFCTLLAFGFIRFSPVPELASSPAPPPQYQIETLPEMDKLLHDLSWNGSFFKEESCYTWTYRYFGGPIVCWVENNVPDVHEKLGPVPSVADWQQCRENDLIVAKQAGQDPSSYGRKEGYVVLGGFKDDNYRLFVSAGGKGGKGGGSLMRTKEKRFLFKEKIGYNSELSSCPIPLTIQAGQEVTILRRKFGDTSQELKVRFLTEDELTLPAP